MALLGRNDGDDTATGASYLDLVDFLMRHGSRPEADLGQLWKRIVFSLAVADTDDHLRNRGFLLEAKGWRLSQAYDINPSLDPCGLAIDKHDNSLDFSLALPGARKQAPTA
jgi:serine/threonine-protein kinase HipA